MSELKPQKTAGDWLVVVSHRGRLSIYSAMKSEAEAFKQVEKTKRYSRRYVVHRSVFDTHYAHWRFTPTN